MLKAFTKVFHKSHDPPEEQPAARRVLERHRPAELGLGSAGQAARVPDARAQGAPRRVGAGSYAPLPPPMGAQPTKDAGQHTSLQYRMEQQQVLPRLHVKAPASGPDGGFPLTAENLEWHLRMLPPMKESKYDRILRYVRDQQQHVAAAAAGDPGQHDIEQSMLMSGGPIHHHDYADPRLAPMEHAAPQPGQFLVPAFGTAPVFVQQPHGGGMQPRMAADRGYTAAPGPAYPAAGAAAQKPVPPQANHVAVRPADAAAVAIRHTRDASADPHADNEEEDDNTPLAAISWAAPALQPAALQVAIPGAGLDGLYSLDDSLDGPLPSPVRLAMGDRISMMSFPSNMAVNFASEANEANSRTLSASLHEINNSLATPAPLTPTAHDAPVLRLSTHSGSSPHSMLAPLRAVDQLAPPADTDGCMAPPDAESAESAVALRVVNHDTSGAAGKSNRSDDDDDEDNQPLVALTRRLSERPVPELLRVSTTAAGAAARCDDDDDGDDDDDDRPLSALLLQSHAAAEDLGCLPRPPHVHDPDAAADLDDIVNEPLAPLRTSIGSRIAAQGVARKRSLLSHAFRPDMDRDDSAAAPAHRARRPHRDRHSTPLSVPRSPGEARLATEAPYSSLPRPPLTRPPLNYGSDEDEGEASDAPGGGGVEAAAGDPGIDGVSGGAGRPWLQNRDYSVSESSLSTNHRRAKRGSALGQQLTEDLQRVRKEIARERRESDLVARHSWQVGTLEAVPRPWMRDENTLSDSALARDARPARQGDAPAGCASVNSAAAHSDMPGSRPSWSFSIRPRPVSTQNGRRFSLWHGRGGGSGQRSNSAPLGANADQLVPAPASTSLSARINTGLGRLKRTLRPGSSCIQ